MTLTMLGRTLLVAFALLAFPQIAVRAENNDQDKSDKPPATSPQSSGENQQSENQTNDNTGAANGQPSQTDKQPSQNNQPDTKSNTTPNSQNQNNNNPSNSSSEQSNTDRDAAPKSDAKNDTNQTESRSVLKTQNRDSQADSQANDRNRNGDANSKDRDSRTNSGRQANRDYRRDFKFGQSVNRGLTVTSLVRDSIFYRSGVRDGDIFVSYGGRPIRSQDDFTRFVIYQPGQKVPVVVLRDGREETVYVVYEQDVAQLPASGSAHFGAEFDPQANDAAVILRVAEGSPAHKAGLAQGDIVIALNGERVASGRDAIQIVSSLNPGERLQVDFTRHARTEVLLGSHVADSNVNPAGYQLNDRGDAIAVGVGTAEPRRADERDRDRRQGDSQNSDRRDSRGGILPRLRN